MKLERMFRDEYKNVRLIAGSMPLDTAEINKIAFPHYLHDFGRMLIWESAQLIETSYVISLGGWVFLPDVTREVPPPFISEIAVVAKSNLD